MSTDADKEQVASVDNPTAKSGSSPRVVRAEQFSRFGISLTGAEDLTTVGFLLRDFCEKLWDWDALLFSVRRGRSSYHFRSVLLIDTINGIKVNCTREEFRQADYSVTWSRVLEGEPVLINRGETDTPKQSVTFGNHQQASASLLFVPITVGDRVVGVLSLQSYTTNKFNVDDQKLLMTIAEVVGPTLLRCHAEERMQEFLRLGERLNQVVDTAGVTRVVANAASNLIGWDFLSLHLWDPKKATLQLVLGLRRSEKECHIFHGEIHDPLKSESLLIEVLDGRAVALDVGTIPKEDHPQFYPFGDTLPLLTSVILAPIRSMNRAMGLLCLQSQSSAAYGAEEAEIIRGLTDYCGGALDRAWAQQNLKESEEHYRLLVENVNDGIVISQDDHFIFFNDRFADMLGYDAAELRSKTYLDVYTEAGLSILNQRAAARNAGEVVSERYETLFRTKNGDQLPVEANVRISQDYRGRKATFAVVRDITERKLAEQKLRASEERLRTLFEAITDLIVVLDSNGTYLQYGTGGKELLIAPWEEIAGKTVYDIFSREKADYFLRLFHRSLKNQETLNVEYDLEDSDGNQRWFNASISPLSDELVLLMARDITERRKADEELFRSNARYEALLDGSEDYIFVLDREMRFVHVNSVVEKRFDVQPMNRIGRTLWEIYGKNAPPLFVKLIQSVFETGKPVTYDDDAVINGNLVCTETVISPVYTRTGEVEAVLGISRDVTGRRQAAMALKQSEERYAAAVRGANDGIWDWNLEVDHIYLSSRWWGIIGESQVESETEYKPSVWLDRIHGADAISLREKIADHIDGRTPHLEDEHRILHSDGTWRWVLCRGICVRGDNGTAIQMAGSMSDITARKTAEEKLHYGASHDALTGLPNRAYFLSCLTKTMGRTRRRTSEPEQFAVLFLDLDRFKVINDSLGHLAGDELIIATARRLESCVRPGDVVSRLGGDEFTVLLEDLSHSSDAIRVAQRFIRELSAPISISGFAVQTTVSIGIAFDRIEYQQPEDMLRDADTAMYGAKASGRNRYQVFDQKMHEHAMEQLHLEGDLRRAVARQEFVMHYQPVYALSPKRLIGFEALVRWNHPERGLVSPASFIPLAEENGLIIPIGWWVIDEAARACASWNANRPADDQLTVSINISPRQFSQTNLLTHINFLVNNAGAARANIILEITENILMDDSQNVAEVLHGLRDGGFRLDLDDFGTGYSSLSFLRKFPLDMLKIDQSFVKELGHKPQSREIVNAILGLARGLGLGVTAEGVETKEQFDALVELQCDWAQGYYLNRPMPLEKTLELLRASPPVSAETDR